MEEYGNPWDYDPDIAFRSLNNLSENLNSSSLAINMSNYTDITNITNVSLTDNEQTANAIFSAANKLWIQTVFGSWFYVICVFVVTVIVFAKHDGDVGVTAWTLLLLSGLVAAPATAGEFYIPMEILNILYVFTGLGFIGVLYSFWVGN